MATKKKADKNEESAPSEIEDLPQFNYRHVGEPETLAEESKETPGGQRDRSLGSAPKTRSEQGLSEMAGMSEEKSQRDIDLENAWTTRK